MGNLITALRPGQSWPAKFTSFNQSLLSNVKYKHENVKNLVEILT